MTLSQAKQKLLNWCKDQIGYTEGINNWTKYADSADLQRLYGWKAQNQPWCDLFYDIAMIECFGLHNASRLTYQPIGQGSAACKYSAAFYAAHNALMDKPESGDQIFFYDSNGEINHTGIVEAVGGGIVYTIEGNKNDRVQRGAYAIGDTDKIAGYGRPAWKYVIEDALTPAEPTIKVPDEGTKVPKKDTCEVTAFLPTLSYGKTGVWVKVLQLRLIDLGYKLPLWGADGDFGSETQGAVEKLQKDNKLNVDSIVGKATWAVILKA